MGGCGWLTPVVIRTQNVQSVTNTFKDFTNAFGQNDALWLDGSIALFYSDFLSAAQCGLLINPQSGLNNDDTAISIILPTGLEKLQRVSPDLSELAVPDRKASTGIAGLSGQMDRLDYVYTTGKYLKESIKDWQDDSQGRWRVKVHNEAGQVVDVYTGPRQPSTEMGFTAYNADGNPVIIMVDMV
jgi:gas vesicle protein